MAHTSRLARSSLQGTRAAAASTLLLAGVLDRTRLRNFCHLTAIAEREGDGCCISSADTLKWLVETPSVLSSDERDSVNSTVDDESGRYVMRAPLVLIIRDGSCSFKRSSESCPGSLWVLFMCPSNFCCSSIQCNSCSEILRQDKGSLAPQI